MPTERKALHDIHLRFESKGLWSLMSASSICKPDSYSKDIRLLPLKAGGGITIRTTVHSTDTVSLVVGCSLAPIAVDISGIIRLSNALTRVEERLSRVIEAQGEQATVKGRGIPLPCILDRYYVAFWG
jgi:hypothetical protein